MIKMTETSSTGTDEVNSNSTDTTGGLGTATNETVSTDPRATKPGTAAPATDAESKLPKGSISDEPILKSDYQLWKGNNTPPIGWVTQSQVTLPRLGDKTPHMDITALTIDQDVTSGTGSGTLTVAWDEKVYDNLQASDEIRIWWGYTKPGITLPFQTIKAPSMKDDMAAYPQLKTLTVLPAVAGGKVNDDLPFAMHNVENIPLVFTGYIKDVKPSAATIVIDLYDKGVLLEKTCTATFQNEKRSKIAADLCHQAGMLCYIDWAGKKNFDEVVATFPGGLSTSSTTNPTSDTSTAADGDSGTGSQPASGTTSGKDPTGTGTGPGTPTSSTSVGAPVAGTGNTPQAGAATSQTICSSNSVKDTGCKNFSSVPYAGDGPHCFFNQCQSPTCMKTGKLVYPSPMPGCSQQIHCMACQADYCGKTGEELSGKCAYALVPASGTTASTATNQTGTSSATYWDTLIALMQLTTIDVDIYIHLDTVYIKMIPPQSEYNLIIDDTWNVKKDSVTITDPLTEQPNAVIVRYGKNAESKKLAVTKNVGNTGKKALSAGVQVYQPKDGGTLDVEVGKNNSNNQNISVYDPTMFDKYGYNPITVTAPQYDDAMSATKYALKQLAVAERNNGMQVDLTIIGTPYIYPHWWCKTILSRYGKTVDKVMYLAKTSLKLTAGKTPMSDITLEDYYPDISISTSSGTSGVLNTQTMQGIIQSASGWTWCSDPSEADLEKNGCGDCYAMSDYLYEKLNAAGIPTRILQYYSPYSGSGTHRTVQVENNGQWEDMPGYSSLATGFHPLSNKKNCFIYKQPPATSPSANTQTTTSSPTG